jgi:RNA polymerase sigma-70 factor, ECF subfamily
MVAYSQASLKPWSAQSEFEAVWRCNRRRAVGLAYRMVRSVEDAEDVAQDAAVRAWKHFEEYDRRVPFDRWMDRIVTNLCIDKIRSRRRRATSSLSDVEDFGSHVVPLFDKADHGTQDPYDTLAAETLGEELEAALAAMPASFRRAVWLVTVEEHSYAEVARIEGCPVGTVRSRLCRGRRLLRRMLGAGAPTPTATHYAKDLYANRQR